MQNIHGKEIDLLRTTVKVPGKRLPRAATATAASSASPKTNGLAKERSVGGGVHFPGGSSKWRLSLSLSMGWRKWEWGPAAELLRAKGVPVALTLFLVLPLGERWLSGDPVGLKGCCSLQLRQGVGCPSPRAWEATWCPAEAFYPPALGFSGKDVLGPACPPSRSPLLQSLAWLPLTCACEDSLGPSPGPQLLWAGRPAAPSAWLCSSNLPLMACRGSDGGKGEDEPNAGSY